jgi:serine/threonine protein kinase
VYRSLVVLLPHCTAASLNCRRVLFQQLIVALDYLHAKGAAHRDIKLENTLLQVCDKKTCRICYKGPTYDL